MHWPLQDPAAAQGSEETILVTFRSARDQVEVLVRRLLHDLA